MHPTKTHATQWTLQDKYKLKQWNEQFLTTPV